MLKEFKLGDEAIEYITQQLTITTRTLSSLLLEIKALDEGRVVTHISPIFDEMVSLEDGSEVKAYLKFEWGRSATGARLWILQFILQHLRGPGKPYAIYLETIGRLGEPWNEYFLVDPFFSYETDIYYFHTIDNHSLESSDPDRMIRKAGVYPGIIVLTSLPDDAPEMQDRQVATKDLLTVFATRATHILVCAYDAEGWLVWSQSEK